MINRLIHKYDGYSNDEEQLLIEATLIEDQLITAGAEGGKDYTILDCFKLASEQMKTNAIKKLTNEVKKL